MAEAGTDKISFEPVAGRDGISWQVRRGFAGRLFEGGRFIPWSRPFRQVEIKRTVSRLVVAADLDGPDPLEVIVKVYLARRAPEGLFRGILLPSPAEIEARHALGLLERGIQAAEPLAFGVRLRGLLTCESFLVSMRFPRAQELEGALRGRRIAHGSRIQLIHGLAGLFRALHASGALHGDPHLQNILLLGDLEEPRLVLTDLRRVELEGRTTERSRIGNLALLAQAAAPFSTRSDRRRFLDSYLEAGIPDGMRRKFAKAVLARAMVLRRRLAKRRARKALRGDRRFERRVEKGMVWHLRTSEAGDYLLSLIRDPEIAFRSPDRVFKESRSSAVVRYGRFVVKRFHQKRRRSLVLDRFRLGRARRNFARSVLLEVLGIPTARVLAAGERRRWGLVTGGYLVSLEVPGARTFLQCIREEPPDRLPLKAAGRLIARLHDARIAHRDLKAPNIIVDRRGMVSLIDLDGLRPAPWITPRRAARDLGRFVRDLMEEAGGSLRLAEPAIEAYCAERGMAKAEILKCMDSSTRDLIGPRENRSKEEGTEH